MTTTCPLLRSSCSSSPLWALILRQDWQRVLIRVHRYPEELTMEVCIALSEGIDLELTVMPLHLICALDPPVEVVQLLLQQHHSVMDAAATAAVSVQPHHYPSKKNHNTNNGRRSRSHRPGRPQQQQEGHKWPHHTTTTRRRGVPPSRRRTTTTRLAKKLRSWRDHRNGSFPQFPMVSPQPSGDIAEDVDLGSVEPRRFLLPHGPQPVGGEESVNEYSPPKKTTNHHGVFLYCDCDDQSSLSSNDGPSIRVLEQPSPCWNNHDDDEMDLTTKPGVVLQLSPSGGLAAMPLPASPPRPPHDKETERTWEESERNNETFDDTPSTVSLSSSRRSAEQQQTTGHDNDGGSWMGQELAAPFQGGFTEGLAPTMLAKVSNDTESTSSGVSDTTTSSPKNDFNRFVVEWDIQPLLDKIARHDGTRLLLLLPIHIACIFQASPSVLDLLIRAYPGGASTPVLGMLPIHLVAAGWNLPTLCEPNPETTLALSKLKKDGHDDETTTPGPLESLQMLCESGPVDWPSDKHGKTAMEYLDECMKDGDYKDQCRHVLLSGVGDGTSHESLPIPLDTITLVASSSSKEENKADFSANTVVAQEKESSTVNSSFSSSSRYAMVPPPPSIVDGLLDMIVQRDWTRALELVEDDPTTAHKWYYGVDHQGHSNMRCFKPEEGGHFRSIWKRLPIHMACIENAPIGFLDLLLGLYPMGAAIPDPSDGSLPLQLVCKTGTTASSSVVQLLLDHCPDANQAVDFYGRSALHSAVIHGASLPVIQCLLEEDPEAVVWTDQSGRNPLDYAMEGSTTDKTVTELLTMVLHALGQHAAGL